ncbi:hypothetical protein D9M71_669510 [compost metagenome]
MLAEQRQRLHHAALHRLRRDQQQALDALRVVRREADRHAAAEGLVDQMRFRDIQRIHETEQLARMPAEYRPVHRHHVGEAELREVEEVAALAFGERRGAEAEVAPARAAGAAAVGEDHRRVIVRPVDLAVVQLHAVHRDETAAGTGNLGHGVFHARVPRRATGTPGLGRDQSSSILRTL